MACALNWEPEDCALGHWCEPLKPLGVRREPASWRADCPHCGGDRLAFWVDSGSIRWKCHHPDCDRRLAHRELVRLIGACVPAFRSREPEAPPALIHPAQILAIVDAGMSRPLSIYLAFLELTGMSTTEALDYLKVRREHRPRIIAGRPYPIGCKTAGRRPSRSGTPRPS